jgi:hypothetical protein
LDLPWPQGSIISRLVIKLDINQKSRLVVIRLEMSSNRKGSFFLRGFISPLVSARPHFSVEAYNTNKRGRPHPFRGRGARGRQN